MSDKIKDFRLGDILTITTAKWLVRDGGKGLGGLITHLYGRTIPASLAAIAAYSCREELLKQHPTLSEIIPSYPKGEWESWLAKCEETYGEFLGISPLSETLQQSMSEQIEQLSKGEKIVNLPE